MRKTERTRRMRGSDKQREIEMSKGLGFLISGMSPPRQPGTVIRSGSHPIMINARMMNGNANVCEVAPAIKGGISLTLSSCQIHHCQGWFPASPVSHQLHRSSPGVKEEAAVEGTERESEGGQEDMNGSRGESTLEYLRFVCVTWNTDPPSVLCIQSRMKTKRSLIEKLIVTRRRACGVWHCFEPSDLALADEQETHRDLQAWVKILLRLISITYRINIQA